MKTPQKKNSPAAGHLENYRLYSINLTHLHAVTHSGRCLLTVLCSVTLYHFEGFRVFFVSIASQNSGNKRNSSKCLNKIAAPSAPIFLFFTFSIFYLFFPESANNAAPDAKQGINCMRPYEDSEFS